jgi:hypothetical protein
MKIWTLAALAWAGLMSAACHAEPAAAWLAIGTIAFAPLALVAIASRVKAKPGSMAAADAEALAWSQPSPPARRPPAGRAIPAASVRWRAQPLSA